MDEARVQSWLDRYVEAWKRYDPALIGDLFSDDVVYRYGPFEDGVRGRQAVVRSWLEDRDAPGTYDARYEPWHVSGEVAVAIGWSRYFAADGSTLEDEYGNCFLVRFDGEGRCREFGEYWMRRRRAGDGAPEGEGPSGAAGEGAPAGTDGEGGGPTSRQPPE